MEGKVLQMVSSFRIDDIGSSASYRILFKLNFTRQFTVRAWQVPEDSCRGQRGGGDKTWSHHGCDCTTHSMNRFDDVITGNLRPQIFWVSLQTYTPCLELKQGKRQSWACFWLIEQILSRLQVTLKCARCRYITWEELRHLCFGPMGNCASFCLSSSKLWLFPNKLFFWVWKLMCVFKAEISVLWVGVSNLAAWGGLTGVTSHFGASTNFYLTGERKMGDILSQLWVYVGELLCFL